MTLFPGHTMPPIVKYLFSLIRSSVHLAAYSLGKTYLRQVSASESVRLWVIRMEVSGVTSRHARRKGYTIRLMHVWVERPGEYRPGAQSAKGANSVPSQTKNEFYNEFDYQRWPDSQIKPWLSHPLSEG